jgi:cytochrome c
MRELLTRRAGVALALLAACATATCTDAHPPGAEYRTVPHGDAQRGRVLLARYQCGSCHAVPGIPGRSIGRGPALDGFGLRSYIAGRVPNSPATLQQWLQAPQSLVPETTMPALGVSPDDARDIAAYLLSLS